MNFQFNASSVNHHPALPLRMAALRSMALLGFGLVAALGPTAIAQSKIKPVAIQQAPLPVNDALALKAEHGPWLIMAKSFNGPEAKTQAEQLAAELRKDFRLQAYCLNRRFDYTQRFEGAGFDDKGRERKMKFHDAKVVDGYAVLIGDYDSVDSPTVVDALEKIKRLKPRTLVGSDKVDPKKPPVDVSSYRNYLMSILPRQKDSSNEPLSQSDLEELRTRPMFRAFVTRNPLLPAEYYKAPVLDKFVQSLNAEKGLSEHSLLSCPGKFTVRVVVFRGSETSESWGRSAGALNQENQVSQLDVAAERAMLTVRALRKAGYEAYQFHDRSQSYVTVGSFDELGSPDATNKFIHSRGIQEVVNRFGPSKKLTQSRFGITQSPTLLFDLVDQKLIPELNEAKGKALGGWLAKDSVAFDLIPAPMAVPRVTSNSIYGGSFLGKRK
jgi:hypothetical protein